MSMALTLKEDITIDKLVTEMAKSQGEIVDRAPPKSPMAVRTPDVITTSLITQTRQLIFLLTCTL
jgi:hypothetical protein